MITWIKHNQGMFIALIVSAILVLWSYGCESKVESLISEKQVTRSELQVELQTEVHRLESELDNLQQLAIVRNQQLDRKDAIKAKLFDTLSVVTQTGQFNPAGLIGAFGILASLGLGVDNRIKDKVIKNRPLSATQPQTDIDRG